MSAKTDERARAVTISMGTEELEDGSFVVQVYLTGIASQGHADAAMAHIQRLLCGDEIKPQ